MLQYAVVDFEHWRRLARQLRLNQVHPQALQFLPTSEQLLFLSPEPEQADVASDRPQDRLAVSKQFMSLAENVGFHRDNNRWNILYRLLWRLTTAEPNLLQIFTDDDVYALMQMNKAVTRDAHKMKAFVRFRQVQLDDVSYFVAWHSPDHLVLRLVAPFFARRFKSMNWTVLTPDESVTWDQEDLAYHRGVPRNAAPAPDEWEDVWRTYYANIFNPARIKLKAMKAEMPIRHWATLPETQEIEAMLRDAPQRQQTMIERSEGLAESARDYFPAHGSSEDNTVHSLASLAAAAQQCRACGLHCHATQVVFGRGSSASQLVLVGEQPGDQEDLAGEPFIGPAGKVLDQALGEAGLQRSEIYVTNVVKHFKHEMRGKFRLHKRPDAREVRACRPWFEAEWSTLSAKTLVCLGATAATALIAPGFRLQQQRGQWVTSQFSDRTLATWHPSSILRLPSKQDQERRLAELVQDLRKAGTCTSSAAT